MEKVLDFNVEDVKEERGFYSDIYKSDNGFRPREMNDQQLTDWMNQYYKVVGNQILDK